MTIQYHSEAARARSDNMYLFEHFVEWLEAAEVDDALALASQMMR